jgi:predicted ATPase/signal transduction histidine kinase
MPASFTYAITETLYESGRAALYRAVRREDRRPVVLKVLGPRRPSPRDVERLKNEYMVGQRLLALPRVLHVVALDTYRGMPALVLEDFDGEPLDRFIEAPIEVGRFLRIAVQLAGALAEIHGAGVVHKDIKPENILVGAGDVVRVADFELASLLPRDQAGARSPRLVEGSLPYMSPEQTGRTNRSVDHRTDLYSLGVVFYQLLAGRLPFAARDPVEWVYCHLARSPPPLRDIVPAVPPTLDGSVMKLLAKVPEDRYQSARGVEHDLERCLAQWEATGRIEPFPLGERDVSERFQIPQKLYGREQEIAVLLAAKDRLVATGTPELLLVSGRSGSGKSALVHELREPVVRERGFFVRGKFDQYKRNIPYSTIVEALQEVVLEILAESDERVGVWRQEILEAVGMNGRLIIAVIPPIELIVGEQPKVPDLPLSEARSRFDVVLQRFIMVFAKKEHPLVLFLDDLQWADLASLKLLRDVLTHPDTRHLLVLGAYRDNEMSPSHPAILTIGEVRRAGAAVSDLVLGPLSGRHLTMLVADTLHCAQEDAEPLARLVHEKTGGNPFFAVQFLTALHQERLIEFDPRAMAWRWDVARIREKGFTDNVVELMVDRLRRLPAVTQRLLTLAACIGNVTSARALAVASERSEGEVHCDLWPSLQAGLTLRVDDTYRFLHDRVQQAACSLIPKGERPAVHLRIGRLLLAETPREDTERAIFEIVSQLNLGASLISSPAERAEVAELNLVAGRKAQSSAAYDAAIGYLAKGTALLEADSWQERYELTYALNFHRAQCAYMTGDLRSAESLLGEVLRRARTNVDRAEVYRVKIDLHVTKSENREAVESALECLRLFGVEMSLHPTRADVIEEYDKIRIEMTDRRIEDLIDLPPMTDAEMRAAMHVLSVLFAPAYFTDPNLLHLHLCHMVNISLRHGNTDASAHGYAWFGVILGPVFHRYQDGLRFGKLAHDLVERNNIVAYRAKAYYSLELIALWTQPIDTAIEHIRKAFEVGVQTGDVTVTCYSCNHLVTDRLLRGDRLDEVYRESVERLGYVQKAGFHDVAAIIVSIQRFIQDMRGLTTSFSTFGDASFDEREFERGLTEERMATMVCWYYILKLAARFLSGDYEEALAAGARAKELLWASLSHPQIHEYHYYSALVLGALHDQAPPERQKEWLAAMAAHEAELAEWAGTCPSTFRDKHALVSAEIARVSGRAFDAVQGYEEALRAAKAGGFVQNEGIGYEVAARFYLQRGLVVFAQSYLLEARSCYAAWGADGKVKDLDRRYPHLVERRPLSVTGTFAVPAEELDLLSVVKASQAISREILLENLVRRLIEVAVEQGGAEIGVLLVCRDRQLFVEARAAVGEGGVEVKILQSVPVTSSLVPTSIINYCLRTKQRVILENAADAGRFSSDDYVARTRPRSVLCLPIRRQAEVEGLLYLENNLVTGAFTPERLAVLELLAAQAAISLENAMLLSQERAAREAAEAAEARAALLAEASKLLSSSLEIEETLAQLALLCVRQLASSCVVDLLEEGKIRPMAAAHRDPAKAAVLLELRRRFPLGADSPHPLATAMRTEHALLAADVTEAGLRTTPEDAELDLLRELAPRGYIAAPFVARGRVLGAIGLGAAGSERRFGQAELEIAEELAARAAVAVDNAQLFRATREAVRLRNEFISIASHELYTPMTALMLSLQSLTRAARTGASIASKPTEKLLTMAERQGQRLTKLIGNLLDASRLEAGRIRLEVESVDLLSLVREIVARSEPDLSSARCDVSVHCDAPVVGRWDRSRLEQVVVNLLSNAMRYGGGSPIEIWVEDRAGVARLTVRDRGIGIEPARQGRIFERFERAVSAEHFGGLGLGLYICRGIVAAHGGTIAVESQPGEGATFRVELPCAGPPGSSDPHAQP